MKIGLNRLSKEFASARGSTLAVREIDLDILEGEFFVLLGPSGCGKSTVLNLIAGLEKPSGGEIRFDEQVVASPEKGIFVPPGERNVAMVFQSYALYPHLSVFRNIAFPLEIAGEEKKAIETAVEEAASMLGITELLAARPGELSGGQRQRVAIARALVRHPRVFLMDEPLSNLDAQLRTSTRTELKSLQNRLGVTTIYVTHDQIEAMSLGDRIAVLRNGRLEQVDSAEALYENPVNTFVAGFIASPPMNLLEIALERHGNHWVIRIDDEELIVPAGAAGLFERLQSDECILGVRPEHLHIRPGGGAGIIDAKVAVVEPMGREVLFHLGLGSRRLLVLTSERKFSGADPGDSFHVEPDWQCVHLFTMDGVNVGVTT
jgi:multiple sugar transport system ATP-binding protein